MDNKQKEAIKILEECKQYDSESNLYLVLGQSYQGIQEYTKAESYFYKAINMIPYKMYPRYLLVKLYAETGQKQKAIIEGNRLLTMKVKNTSTAVEDMKDDIKKIFPFK